MINLESLFCKESVNSLEIYKEQSMARKCCKNYKKLIHIFSTNIANPKTPWLASKRITIKALFKMSLKFSISMLKLLKESFLNCLIQALVTAQRTAPIKIIAMLNTTNLRIIILTLWEQAAITVVITAKTTISTQQTIAT